MFGKDIATELENAKARVPDFDLKYDFLSKFTEQILTTDYDSISQTGDIGKLYAKVYIEMSEYISPSRRDLLAFFVYFTTIFPEYVYRHMDLISDEFYIKQAEAYLKESPADAPKVLGSMYENIEQTMKGIAELGDPVSHPENEVIPATNHVNWFVITDYMQKLVEKF